MGKAPITAVGTETAVCGVASQIQLERAKAATMAMQMIGALGRLLVGNSRQSDDGTLSPIVRCDGS